MTKKEYLDLTGYDPKVWDIMSKESSERYRTEKGAVNNMYQIKDRKGITAFGNGCFIIKLQWMMDTIDIMEAEGRAGGTVKPEKKEAVVPVPPPAIPPVPPVIEVPVPPVVPPPPIVPPVPIPPVLEKTDVEKTGNEWVCDRYDHTGVSCDDQCPICKDAEAGGVSVDEQKVIAEAKLKKIVAESGVPADNVIIATVPKIDETATVVEEGLDHKGGLNDVIEIIVEDKKEFLKDLHGEDFDENSNTDGVTVNIDDIPEEVIEESKPNFVANVLEVEDAIIVPLNEDGSVDTSNMTKEEAHEAILIAQEDTKKGKLVGSLTGRETTKEDIERSAELSRLAILEEQKKKIGFFSTLCTFGFQQLSIAINRIGDDKLNVIVKPQNFSGDPAYDTLKPLSLNGTIEEIDTGFFEAIGRPLEVVSGLMANAKSFIEEAADAEKKTKANKAIADKLKKDFESAKKFYEKDGFDIKKSAKTALNKFLKITEVDPKHKGANDCIEKINKELAELRKGDAETLL